MKIAKGVIRKYCPYCRVYFFELNNKPVNCKLCGKRLPEIGTIRNNKGRIQQ